MIRRSPIPRTRLAAVLIAAVTIFGADLRCSGIQYQPIDAYSTIGDECALVLDGPGRSSAFDYTYNLLRGTFPPSAGSQTCITYDAVNHAYIEARKRINVAQPNTETWRGEDLATVGELLLDISTNLAQKYGLTYDDIEKGLPLIDTSKTLIREVCPAFLSNVECRPGKYRRYDGLCTNLENPTWGATMTPFSRLLPPRYSDGINSPRISVTGNQLPLARVVSRTMHPDEGYHDHAGTVMVIAWGQFMDHDYTLTATPLDLLNRNDPEECCHRPPHLKNPYCNEILIPEDDYFYRLFGVRCMDFVRGFPAPRPGCRLGSRVQFNLLTGVLDGNTVYGVSDAFARKLRTGYGGLLRMNPVFSEYGLKDLLPLKLDIPDEGCTRPNRSMYCFEAGEIRVNEQLVLTCMHTLLAREHNRAANALAQVNPHWDDETIFQEARRIVIAEIQHVTYNEFLPILLGKEVMEKFGLLLEKDGYWDGYDPSVNPGVLDAFAAAAYRFGHSLLPTAVERWSKAHKFIASKRLSDLIRRPYDLYRAGVLDEYFMGLMNQVAQAMDDSITQEVTNHLFKKVGAKFGMDLVSFNMQRGREFGLPSYMEFRKFCGLPGADTFEELFGSMPNETIRRYSSIFQHPSDVDLWSGGVSERPLPGSMLGPTFACIIATQFSYSRRGDRFWYELPNQPSSFTPEQLTEIRKSRMARLICDNTDLIDTIQIYPMVLPDHEINPRVPCRSGILPSIDFSKWAEFPSPPTAHAAQYNFPGPFVMPVPKPMPPLVYARMPKASESKNNLVSKPKKTSVTVAKILGLAGLRPSKISATSVTPETKPKPKPDKKSIGSPWLMMQRSTQIYAVPEAGYFFEKSEVSISPMKDIPEEKPQSLRTLLNDLPRSPIKAPIKLPKTTVKKVEQTDPENIFRIMEILSRNRYDEGTQSSRIPLRRSKRQVTADGGENLVGGIAGKKKSRKSGYTPVFKVCNDTAASEISDLNLPPPSPEKEPKRSRQYYRNGQPIPDADVVRTTTGTPIVQVDETVEPPKEAALVDENAKNQTYINLQDHQKGVQDGAADAPKDANGYPADIPPYNPDMIPYVEVPDYTDQREQSLDKDDRRVAKERYVEYPNEEADVVDPEAPAVIEQRPRMPQIIVLDDDVGDSDEVQMEAEEQEEQEEVREETDEEGDDNAGLRQEEEDDEDSTAKDELRNSEPQEDAFDFETLRFDIEDYKKPFNLEELFKEIERETAAAYKQNKTRGDVNEHQGSRRVEVRGNNEQVKRDASKAWDKDFELLKIPVIEESEGIRNKDGKSEEKSAGQDATVVPPNFFEEFDRVFSSSTTDTPFAGYYEDEDEEERLPASSSVVKSDDLREDPYAHDKTYERMFGTGDERNGSEPAKVEDDAYYGQWSDNDNKGVADFLEKKKKSGIKADDEPSDESLREVYETLGTILDRKDDVSRLDDKVAAKAKEEGKMPAMYKNYWTLEYSGPKKKEKT
ncbi:uncharacterized protein LOC107226351 [Neodiprion lecontei]|uniref:Uncharacterized protein LOC107226351 n=1 Tax=Neodiprion lecontei TaxID=441921 RepID=A0A6J0C7L8_NEOLC|nr:uncharacterized protein LOC107226351 [Neodiprion lecontei]